MRRLPGYLLLLLALASLPFGAVGRGLRFAEEMQGYAWFDGEHRGAQVALEVVIDDIDAWRANPGHVARVTGVLYMDRLPARPITGTLAILAPLAGEDGRLLIYRLDGVAVQFTGVKHVRDRAGAAVLDAMTTLRGVFQARGLPAPSLQALLREAAWTSELLFEWWKPAVVWRFADSFRTMATPWYEELEVKAIFVKTLLGALARTLFPWLAPWIPA